MPHPHPTSSPRSSARGGTPKPPSVRRAWGEKRVLRVFDVMETNRYAE